VGELAPVWVAAGLTALTLIVMLLSKTQLRAVSVKTLG
jgi:DHA1 family chloramphenicol resistance protein-like MFS transporter